MERTEDLTDFHSGKKIVIVVLLCVICVAIDFIGSQIAAMTGLPVYFDTLGITLASVFGGYIPGVVVGYATNFATSISDPSSVYYCLMSVLLAVMAAYCGRRGWFETLPGILLCIAGFALIGGGLGSVVSWFLAEPTGGSPASLQAFFESLGTNLGWDVLDKTVTTSIAAVIIRVVPQRYRSLFELDFWQQTPLEGDELKAARRTETRRFSLRTKIAGIVSIVMIIIAVVTTTISFVMYHRSSFEAQTGKGEGVAQMAAEFVDGDRVSTYLQNGSHAAGYTSTAQRLEALQQSFPDVEYVYVYQISEDGCHVVFDPDSIGTDGQPGEVIPFEAAFEPLREDLIAGRPIEPIVSNGDFGWLLTVYQPILDSDGKTTAYAGVDISMNGVLGDELSFLARVVILFAAFFILIIAICLWLAEYGIIMPVNSISLMSGNFAFDSESSRSESVEALRRLNIHTGDEVENLHHAVTKTSEDTVQFIAESKEKAETIERMQDNLIMVMADLVESRDQFTGDHVRKTAAYTRIIMDEMRREGMYPDILTDEFVDNVERSAPLHDVGKIVVSDTILNKPGRLTDEEFDIMKSHTTAGEEILAHAIGAVSDAGYLDEARRLAAYHHEKWNGNGYPNGLTGEDIPLSARIMAVADVFDALVSKRSYKDGMPIEKAFSIIREESGTHFDPQVVEAFLNAEDEVRRVAEQHGDAAGTAEDIRA